MMKIDEQPQPPLLGCVLNCVCWAGGSMRPSRYAEPVDRRRHSSVRNWLRSGSVERIGLGRATDADLGTCLLDLSDTGFV